jgi:hypothetical protein
MNAVTYILASIIVAFVVHKGAAIGPLDAIEDAIERKFLTGNLFRAVEFLLIWLFFLYVASLTLQWWASPILALPGGASLRFSLANVTRPRR